MRPYNERKIMTLYTTSYSLAQNLLADDRFKMGGEMYRIVTVGNDGNNDVVISFYPLADRHQFQHVLTTPQHTTFKIYNQKK
jgi:hypothetical protein